MGALDTQNSSSCKDSKTKGMTQEIRDQAITIEMVIIKVMVAIVIKIQHKGAGGLEGKPSACDGGVGTCE